MNDGANPKYCASCRKSKADQGYEPPCETECREKFPDRVAPALMAANVECREVHDMCFDARDGMSGALDYGVMLRMMELMQIDNDDQLEIVQKVQQVERKLREWNKDK